MAEKKIPAVVTLFFLTVPVGKVWKLAIVKIEKMCPKIVSLLFHHFTEGVLGIPASLVPAEQLFKYPVVKL